MSASSEEAASGTDEIVYQPTRAEPSATESASIASRLSVVRAMLGGAIDVRRSEGSFHDR
jgi:hypothetical protein